MIFQAKHLEQLIERARDLTDKPINELWHIASTTDQPTKKDIKDECIRMTRGQIIEKILMDEFDVLEYEWEV